MKRTVEVKKLASDHLGEAFFWYESQCMGLGFEFLDEWEAVLEYVSEFPESCQKRYKEFRQAKLKRFPYLIIYECSKEKLVVFNVINARRNPSKRYKRKA